MDKKYCNTCKSLKDFCDFNKRSSAKDGLHSNCKICTRARGHDHYVRNKQYYIERNKKTRDALYVKFYSWLSFQKCIDCGEDDPVVLDCDHVRDKKLYNVSEMISDLRSWNLIEKEIEKCEIRCANCHRRKTALRGGFRSRDQHP